MMNRVSGYETVIVYSHSDTVRCSGENLDHPVVYYTIPPEGEVVCGYCDIIFRNKDK